MGTIKFSKLWSLAGNGGAAMRTRAVARRGAVVGMSGGRLGGGVRGSGRLFSGSAGSRLRGVSAAAAAAAAAAADEPLTARQRRRDTTAARAGSVSSTSFGAKLVLLAPFVGATAGLALAGAPLVIAAAPSH